MAVIDDEGRLFGVVNVIDAAVALAVVTMVVASAGLVLSESTGGETPAQETRHAKLSYQASSTSELAWIGRNDTVTLRDDTNATITDTYRSYANENTVSVVATVSYQTAETSSGALAGRESTKLSDGNGNTVKATILERGTQLEISTARARALLSADLSPAAASTIHAGDTVRIGDQRLATIETVTVIPQTRNEQQVWLGVELVALETPTGPVIGNQSVRLDTPVFLLTEQATINGTVTNVGTMEPPGERTNVTLTVEWENVRPSVADDITTGMTDRGVTITDVERSPATVVVTSANGSVYAREHPVNQDVTVTLDATLNRRHGSLYLFETPIRNGEPIDLYFSNTHVRGTITEIES